MKNQSWTPCLRPGHVFLAALLLASAPFVLALEPQEMLHLAKKNMQGRTWKVQVVVQGEYDIKVDGLVHDQDFDLTVKNPRGESRQIVIGEKCWLSVDHGKTWESKPGPDRRFYYLAHAPMHYEAGEKIPPFEKVQRSGDDIPGTVHIRLINKAPISYEGDRSNSWIKLKDDGSPDVLVRTFGPLVLANELITANVHYTLADEEKIIAPPGNPAAVPAGGPEDLLVAAIKRMEQGTWEVDAKIEARKAARVRGLLHGEDFDLSMDPDDGNSTAVHGIRVNGTVYGSLDNGKTWKIEPSTDIAIYNWVHSPLIVKAAMPPFELAAREEHDGETWLKLRLFVEENITDRDQLPTCWIALDKDGKPASVRRSMGIGIRAGDSQNPMKYDITYRPAAKDASISAPPRDLIVNASSSSTDKPLIGKGGTTSGSNDGGKSKGSPLDFTKSAKVDPSKTPEGFSKKSIRLNGGATLTLALPASFELDKKKSGDKKTIASFSRKDGVWGTISRGTNGLTPEGLQTYMDNRVKEYTEKLGKDLGADIHWLRHDIVTLNDRPWADLRFVPALKGSPASTSLKDYANAPLYTRFLSTSYQGQLLEVTFTTNLDTAPETKAILDKIFDTITLTEEGSR